MRPTIRDGHPCEAGFLTALAVRSKAVWGYEAPFLAACLAELTIAREVFSRDLVRVATRSGRRLGFYRLSREGDGAEIEAFFVDPHEIGQGIGRLLWRDLVGRARGAGIGKLVCQSDPHAEGFYRAMGMRRAGMRKSASIAGRYLPLLELDGPGADSRRRG